MGLILNLETSTKTCSVALGLDGKTIAVKETTTENFSHSENLNLFIEAVMQGAGHALSDLDAIAVGKGPGSYTGLRIGVSTAKGLCYGLNIPLIAIDSLMSLANLSSSDHNHLICPMFDARRMEVYSALYTVNMEKILPVSANIIDENSFSEELNQGTVVFLGPGAEKCIDTIQHPNAVFDLDTEVSANGMVELSENLFQNGTFEDVAYFEPFYLKDFIAGKPKKLL